MTADRIPDLGSRKPTLTSHKAKQGGIIRAEGERRFPGFEWMRLMTQQDLRYSSRTALDMKFIQGAARSGMQIIKRVFRPF